MAMYNPPHPGRIVRMECIEALGLTITEAALHLGVTQQAIINLANEKAGISPDIAARLERQGWSTADTWLRMQSAYDQAQARKQADEIDVQRLISA